MTAFAPTQDAASAAAAGSQGADASVASPNGAGGASSAGAGETSQDYLGRIRAGGDFASQEVTKHQSRADQAESKLRKMGELPQWAEQVGPQTIQEAVSRYITLKGDPRFRKAVEALEATGKLPERSNGYDFDDDEPEADPREQELSQLRTRIAELEIGTGSQALQGHVEKFFQEIPLDAAIQERARERTMETIRKWQGMGDLGSRSLRSLQSPNGYDTVKGIMLGLLSKDEILQAGKTAYLRSREAKEQFRTDVPSESATSGREPATSFKSALDALRFAKANPDRI